MEVVISSAAALGVLLHQLFRRREPTIASAVIVIVGADAGLSAVLDHLNLRLTTLRLISALVGVTLATLVMSIVAYRLSPLHPLAHYPGPLLYRVTKLRTVYASWRGTHYKDMKRMHDKYGPVVRMGPNAVSIVDVSAVASVLGANGLPKDRYYRTTPPENPPLIALNGPDHAHRRRLWNRGLGKSALTIHTRTAAAGWERLRAQFDKAVDGDTVVDMTKWLRFYSFDFMGGFVFGREFGLVQSGADDVGAWPTIQKFLFATDIIAHLPWLGWRGAFIPGLFTALMRLRTFARKCVQDRLNLPATTIDLWYYLGTEDVDDAGGRLAVEQLAAEGALALVAGADTSANAMTSMVYFLLTHPGCLARARQEVDAAVANGLVPWTNADCHVALPYLNACMDESLRLLPVAPTSGSRVVPIGSGGKDIAGHLIPEDTEVFVSPYQLHHDPRYFSPDTESFRPERWLDAGWNTQHAAYIPFSAGPAQCVGKNLAKIEIIVVLSGLLRHFDMSLPADYDPKTFLAHVEEHIVTDVPSLPVCLPRRLVRA